MLRLILSFFICIGMLCVRPAFVSGQQIAASNASDLSLLPEDARGVPLFRKSLDPQALMLQIAEQENMPSDSTVLNVFRRKISLWQSSVLVCDWTESMYPYGLQALSWITYFGQKSSHQVRSWVFFNDGDDKVLGEKVIGQTQGIYHYEGDDLEAILELMQKVKQAGRGDDAPENDLEALLYAQAFFPSCKDLILIADAHSEIRDMLLLEALKKALKQKGIRLHIILCGAAQGVSYDYLLLAQVCDASLHVSEKDWEGISTWKEGQEIILGDATYKLEDGQFRRVYPFRRRR